MFITHSALTQYHQKSEICKEISIGQFISFHCFRNEDQLFSHTKKFALKIDFVIINTLLDD